MAEPRADLDPRLVQLPPGVLQELGVRLELYAGREMPGGCHWCEAAVLFVEPTPLVPYWRRVTYHDAECPIPRWGGRRRDAILN